MNLALFYDTETTGFPTSQPFDHESQPHLCQLGAQLVNLDTRAVISSLDVIIRPVRWVIPEGAAAIHGITQEHALAVGVNEFSAVALFLEMLQSFTRIGHNEQFDAKILSIALARGEFNVGKWQAAPASCTAERSKPIVKCPPTPAMLRVGRSDYKTPKLSEAYEHFFSKPLIGAHSAIVDVEACRDVWFACEDHDLTAYNRFGTRQQLDRSISERPTT